MTYEWFDCLKVAIFRFNWKRSDLQICNNSCRSALIIHSHNLNFKQIRSALKNLWLVRLPINCVFVFKWKQIDVQICNDSYRSSSLIRTYILNFELIRSALKNLWVVRLPENVAFIRFNWKRSDVQICNIFYRIELLILTHILNFMPIRSALKDLWVTRLPINCVFSFQLKTKWFKNLQ
jgi:hypothetical protein